jgi:hypothetical protein
MLTYHEKNKKRVEEARYIKSDDIDTSKLEKFGADFKKDWYPSRPYHVIIDGKYFCANIKVDRSQVHFHLACGYDPLSENAGHEEFFSKCFKHLIMLKKDVHTYKDKRGWFYILHTKPKDWERFYRHGEKEQLHFWKRKKHVREWNTYDWYVDWLLDINKRNLTKIGKANYLENRSEGEHMVARALKGLGIRYIPEYYIDWLDYDKHDYRLADFYLPKENIYIEFNGGWDNLNENKRANERKRYDFKKQVYEKNSLNVIYVYPEDLKKIEYILSAGISKIIKEGGSFGAPSDLKQHEEIMRLRSQLAKLESKRIINVLRRILKA